MYSLSVVPGLSLDYLGRLGDIEEDLPLRAGSTRSPRDTEAVTSIHDDAQTDKRMIPKGFRGDALCLTSHRREDFPTQELQDNQSRSSAEDEDEIECPQVPVKKSGIRGICQAIRTWFLKLFRWRSNIRQSGDETTLDVTQKFIALRLYSMDAHDIHCI